jgi:hypothetical protein
VQNAQFDQLGCRRDWLGLNNREKTRGHDEDHDEDQGLKAHTGSQNGKTAAFA